jgi:hypothetical protein
MVNGIIPQDARFVLLVKAEASVVWEADAED